jgi:hypothetical protein
MMETQLPPIRVHAFTKTVPAPRGYVGTDVTHFQQLQVQTPFGWVVVDQEEVPDHVKISLGCYGDTGGWVSKFASLGEFGADGIIHRKP